MIIEKDDFQCKYVIIPKNISKKKLYRIIKKIRLLSFDNCFVDHLSYDFLKEESADLYLWCGKSSFQLHISNFEYVNKYLSSFEKISIKEFLREKRYVNVSIDTKLFNEVMITGGLIVIGWNEKIESLDEESYTLKKPFILHFEKQDTGEVLGTINELGIHCFEDTIEEVISEVKKEILDLYDSLVLSLKHKLAKKPKLWRKILKKHIKYTKVDYAG